MSEFQFNSELSKYEYAYADPARGYKMGPRNMRLVQERFIDRIPTGSSFLDVSCGRGETLEYAAERGLRPQGTEAVAFLCDPRLTEHPMTQALLPELPFKDGQFDYVMNCDVLEHLPAEVIPASITEMVRVAKKQMFFTTTCRASSRVWEGQRVHLHISRFPRNYWLLCADQTGRALDCLPRFSGLRDYVYTMWFDRTQPYQEGWYDKKWQTDHDATWNYFWYDPEFPISRIPGHHHISERTLESQWWDKFKWSVQRDGLRQPVLLHNWFHPTLTNHRGPYYMRDGNHRVYAWYELGHKTIPAIIFGMHNKSGKARTPGMHIDEANTHMVEGHLEFDERYGLPYMVGANRPEEEFG